MTHFHNPSPANVILDRYIELYIFEKSPAFRITVLSPRSCLGEAIPLRNPLIVLKQGTPYLASSAVGGGLHQVTLQNLINVLDFGMDVGGAVVQPNTYGAMWINGRIEAADSAFSRTVLDGVRARGQQIEVVKDYAQTGYWVGVQIRPLFVHKLGGATNQKIPGFVEGY